MKTENSIFKSISIFASKLLRTENFHEAIKDSLRELGSAINVSRVYIFKRKSNDTIIIDQIYEWVNSDIVPQIDNPDLHNFNLLENGFERWITAFEHLNPIYGNIEDFPIGEKQILQMQSIKTILVVPIAIKGVWWGFIGFDECKQKREWTDVEIDTLKIAADIFGAAFERQAMENEYRKHTEEMEVINKTMVGRELKMIELKKEIERLQKQQI